MNEQAETVATITMISPREHTRWEVCIERDHDAFLFRWKWCLYRTEVGRNSSLRLIPHGRYTLVPFLSIYTTGSALTRGRAIRKAQRSLDRLVKRERKAPPASEEYVQLRPRKEKP